MRGLSLLRRRATSWLHVREEKISLEKEVLESLI
jgi:hypothetical protein